jgi:hypothetical protein
VNAPRAIANLLTQTEGGTSALLKAKGFEEIEIKAAEAFKPIYSEGYTKAKALGMTEPEAQKAGGEEVYRQLMEMASKTETVEDAEKKLASVMQTDAEKLESAMTRVKEALLKGVEPSVSGFVQEITDSAPKVASAGVLLAQAIISVASAVSDVAKGVGKADDWVGRWFGGGDSQIHKTAEGRDILARINDTGPGMKMPEAPKGTQWQIDPTNKGQFIAVKLKEGEKDITGGNVGWWENAGHADVMGRGAEPVWHPGFSVEHEAAGDLVNYKSQPAPKAKELGPQAAGFNPLDWEPGTSGPSFLPSPEAPEALPGPRIENIEPESSGPKGGPKGGVPTGALEGMGASLEPILTKLGTFSEQSRDAAKAQSDAAKEQKDVAAIWKQIAQEMQRGQGAMRH